MKGFGTDGTSKIIYYDSTITISLGGCVGIMEMEEIPSLTLFPMGFFPGFFPKIRKMGRAEGPVFLVP